MGESVSAFPIGKASRIYANTINAARDVHVTSRMCGRESENITFNPKAHRQKSVEMLTIGLQLVIRRAAFDG